MGIKTNAACQIVAVLILISFNGCYLRPNFGSPGTIYQQRARAVLSDPFPNNDLGPEIVGGRPRGYDRPLSEPTNIQASPYSELNKTNRGPFQRLLNPRYPRQQPVIQQPIPQTTIPQATFPQPIYPPN